MLLLPVGGGSDGGTVTEGTRDDEGGEPCTGGNGTVCGSGVDIILCGDEGTPGQRGQDQLHNCVC